ncbi:hypothetical protein Ddye_007340 [Dipteronia dyeriana]|uniref:Protein kinase domain-containing protein n=1 Tax=Dipteronia dyeriana TaxID=168575 RepID=A0AAE0CRJ0_9ROSI|nr:hypothetical protein Ddye_007340 [Dipteronia dyeriana]
MSLKIGQGSYGFVYRGKLKGTIELIGYAAGGNSISYYKPLPWTVHVQIVLDVAKDFGLVKLLEHFSEVAATASRIIGTFGYLAPE